MGAGASGDAPLDVDDDDPDALSPKNGSMFCGGEDGTLSLFYDPGPARPAVEKGVVVEEGRRGTIATRGTRARREDERGPLEAHF